MGILFEIFKEDITRDLLFEIQIFCIFKVPLL